MRDGANADLHSNCPFPVESNRVHRRIQAFRLGWRDWVGGELSAPVIALLAALAGMSLLAMCWSLADADGS